MSRTNEKRPLSTENYGDHYSTLAEGEESPAEDRTVALDSEASTPESAVLTANIPSSGESSGGKPSKSYLYLMTFFAAVGGFLFGYDTGVISGALLFIKEDFDLSDGDQEWIVGSATLAAAVGALAAGILADKIGRKKTVVGAAALFVVGSAILGLANGLALLIVGRVIVGLAIGVASNTVPVFIAEVAPPESRGALVTINGMFITGGQFISYLVDAGFAYVTEGWRFMLMLAAVPALVQLVGMIVFIPESPRWQLANGQESAARETLLRVRHDPVKVEQEIEEIRASISESEGSWRDVLAPELRLPLLVGMGLQAFQQFVGINTAMYYSATIFEQAGVGSEANAIWYSCGVSGMNFLATIVSILLIDRAGRRPLMLWTLPGAAIGMVALGVAFQIQTDIRGILALLALLVYIIGFAVGMGPVPWAINSEIYPLKVRAICSSLATTVNWGSNSVVSFTFLSYAKAVTTPGAFWTYAGVVVLAWLFVYFLMPETKGKSMEEIQASFKKNRSDGPKFTLLT